MPRSPVLGGTAIRLTIAAAAAAAHHAAAAAAAPVSVVRRLARGAELLLHLLHLPPALHLISSLHAVHLPSALHLPSAMHVVH
eukprot:COSAG01_NODE_39508_length_475_cov_4.109043_1_plen_82_part_10